MSRVEEVPIEEPSSPHSAESLFKGFSIAGCHPDQIALLLSLCSCTGWSAEYIVSAFFRLRHFSLCPGRIWSITHDWFLSRNNKMLSSSETTVMLRIIREAKIDFVGPPGKSLNDTPRPCLVVFEAGEYFGEQSLRHHIRGEMVRPAEYYGDAQLCSGYDSDLRAASRNHLYLHKDDLQSYGNPTPQEQALIVAIGPEIEMIIKNTLRAWGTSILKELADDREPGRSFGSDNSESYVDLAVKYLEEYVKSFEKIFGLMEESKVVEEDLNAAFHIRSTAFGIKVLLASLMIDRLRVINRVRLDKIYNALFIRVEHIDLPDDDKDCVVCTNPMGFETDNVFRNATQLGTCCDNYICDVCLKRHLGTVIDDIVRDCCPFCRYEFPHWVINRLYGGETQIYQSPIVAEDSGQESELEDETEVEAEAEEEDEAREEAEVEEDEEYEEDEGTDDENSGGEESDDYDEDLDEDDIELIDANSRASDAAPRHPMHYNLGSSVGPATTGARRVVVVLRLGGRGNRGSADRSEESDKPEEFVNRAEGDESTNADHSVEHPEGDEGVEGAEGAEGVEGVEESEEVVDRGTITN